MRCVWVLSVVAACTFANHDHDVVIVDGAIRPDAAIVHVDSAPPPDAAPPVPDAFVPDARRDAPPPPVCGDGVRAPGEVCFGAAQTFSFPDRVYSARLADVDGDGKRDLIYLTRSNVEIRRGNGAGGFAAPAVGPATDSWWLAAGDIDGDGITDLAAAGRQQLTVWFGTGGGAFGPAHTTDLPDGPIALEVADTDGYPGDELIVTTGQSFSVYTWFVSDFDRLYLNNLGACTGAATRDFDGDNLADTIVGDYNHIYPYRGNVDGALATSGFGGDGEVAGIALANVDADAHVDAIVALPALDEVAIYSKVQDAPDQVTTHRYASELWPVTTGTPRLVAAADLDNDGISEVVAGMPDTMRIQLFHPGGAADAAIQLAEPMTSQVFDGDANGDGIADLVVTLQDQIVVLPSAAP